MRRIHRALKGIAVDLIECYADHVRIRVQHGLQHIAAAHAVARNLHALHRGQLVADHLLQGHAADADSRHSQAPVAKRTTVLSLTPTVTQTAPRS